MPPRTITLTVGLDWPKNAAQGRVFVEALAAEFDALKEKRVDQLSPGVSLYVASEWVPGNRDVARMWRRLVRYLQSARILAAHCDPWCYGAQVVERRDDDIAPSVTVQLREM